MPKASAYELTEMSSGRQGAEQRQIRRGRTVAAGSIQNEPSRSMASVQ